MASFILNQCIRTFLNRAITHKTLILSSSTFSRIKCTRRLISEINFSSSWTDARTYLPCILSVQRNYSKKKKSSKRQIDSDDEDRDEEDNDEETEVILNDHNMVSKFVTSLRMDVIVKAGLGITKKKVEKAFYASKVRINGERVMKKAITISENDEIDVIKGLSPDNSKFLVVDRIHMKSVGALKGSGDITVHMQVLKSLIIENYEDPWKPSDELVE